MRICAALLVGIAAGSSCGRAPAQSTAPPINARFGWIASGCLAIADDTLAAGTPLTVVALGDRTSVIDLRVLARGTAERRCPVRAAAAAADPALRFYTLSGPIDVGIAIIGTVGRTGDAVDVNGDTRADQFTRCTASEGVSFAVWTNGRFVGEPFWSGYEYLGYDVEPDCPAAAA
jgi:hypothetical protein